MTPGTVAGLPTEGRNQLLRYVGATLAMVVAAIHLGHPRLGLPRLVVHLQVGTLFDPRPLVFTISGLLIVVGILLVYNGVMVRRVYAVGIVLMVLYLGGYAAWHTVLEHGGFWPHIHAHGHHDQGSISIIITHLLDDRVALLSKLSEVVLLGILVTLLFSEGKE